MCEESIFPLMIRWPDWIYTQWVFSQKVLSWLIIAIDGSYIQIIPITGPAECSDSLSYNMLEKTPYILLQGVCDSTM